MLQTDASNQGIGAVVSQLDDAGHERPVAYFSGKLLPRGKRHMLQWKRNAWPLNWLSSNLECTYLGGISLSRRIIIVVILSGYTDSKKIMQG